MSAQSQTIRNWTMNHVYRDINNKVSRLIPNMIKTIIRLNTKILVCMYVCVLGGKVVRGLPG